MHERYAYGALVFLLLLIPERRVQWLYLAFGVVFTLNLWSAAPPLPIFRVWLPYPGAHSLLGALAMIAITGIVCLWIGSAPEDSPDTIEGSAETPDHRVAVTGGGASV